MARGIWCRWRVCLCFGLARLSPGRGDNKAKAKAASVAVHSSLEDTAHTVHSSLTESCVQPERRRGARWSLSPLTWSVNFFSRACSRLRASSNWPPSCWLARPLTRPPGRDASGHQGALLDQQVTALLTLHLELLVDGVG